MAIDIYVHTCFSDDFLREKVLRFKQEFDGFFGGFCIYPAKKSDEVQIEIASEFGFSSVSYFCVALTNKECSGMIKKMRGYFESELGVGNVLVLFENETKL